MNLEERLLSRSVPADDGSGCMRWQGAHNPKGYGQISLEGRQRPVHRVAYELWVGPIPEGFEIDHVRARGCAHRDCLNPKHLEAVTHIENVRRTPRFLSPTCPSGHVFEPDTSAIRTDGGRRYRVCLVCRREQNQKYKTKRPCPICGEPKTGHNMQAHIRRMHEAVSDRG